MVHLRAIPSEIQDPHDITMLSPAANPWLHQMLANETERFYSSDRGSGDIITSAENEKQQSERAKPEVDRMDSNQQDAMREAGVDEVEVDVVQSDRVRHAHQNSASTGGHFWTGMETFAPEEFVQQALPTVNTFDDSQILTHDENSTPTAGIEGDSKRKDSGTCIPDGVVYDDEFATLLQDIEDLTNDPALQEYMHTGDAVLQTAPDSIPLEYQNEEIDHRFDTHTVNELPPVSVNASTELTKLAPNQLISPQPLAMIKVEPSSSRAWDMMKDGVDDHLLPHDPGERPIQQAQTAANPSPSLAAIRKAGKQALMEEMRDEQYCAKKNSSTSSFDTPLPFNVLVSTASPVKKQEESDDLSLLKRVVAEAVADDSKFMPVEQVHDWNEDDVLLPSAKRQKKNHNSISESAKKVVGSVTRSGTRRKPKAGCGDTAPGHEEKLPEISGETNTEEQKDGTEQELRQGGNTLDVSFAHRDTSTLKPSVVGTEDAPTLLNENVSAELPTPQHSKTKGQGGPKKKQRCLRELNHLGWDKW